MPGYRIAIVGPKEAIAGFSLLGVDVYSIHEPKETGPLLLRLKKETVTDENGRECNRFGIIFVAEDFLSALSMEDDKRLARGSLPAIIPLPSHRGSSGYGLQRLKRIVERAVGSDILK